MVHSEKPRLAMNSDISGPLGMITSIILISTVGYLFVNSFITPSTEIKAESYAIQKYGDKKVPLTQEERNEWYKEMRVTGEIRLGYNPSRTQLENFIDEKQ